MGSRNSCFIARFHFWQWVGKKSFGISYLVFREVYLVRDRKYFSASNLLVFVTVKLRMLIILVIKWKSPWFRLAKEVSFGLKSSALNTVGPNVVCCEDHFLLKPFGQTESKWSVLLSCLLRFLVSQNTDLVMSSDILSYPLRKGYEFSFKQLILKWNHSTPSFLKCKQVLFESEPFRNHLK